MATNQQDAFSVDMTDCGDVMASAIASPLGPDFGQVIPIQDSTLNWNSGEIEYFPGGPGDKSGTGGAVSGVDAIVNHEG